MKAWIKYRFSRLIVLLVALNTLDASVDIDHLTHRIGWFCAEKFDDIDSISEYVLENLFHDDNLVKEGNNDDRPVSKSRISQFSLIVFCVGDVENWNVKPDCQQLNYSRPYLRNTSFHFEDHSSPDYNPPDFNHPQA